MTNTTTAGPEDGAEAQLLRAQLTALQDERVEDWVRLIRFGGTVPLAVERSLSWRITRPLRLVETALGVLKRDGWHRFWAAVRTRLARLIGRS